MTQGELAGSLLAAGLSGEAVPLVDLFDVLRHCAQTRPGKVAMRHLVKVLSSHAGLSLYELRRDDWALAVADSKVWREAQEAQEARWAWIDNRANPDGTLKPDVKAGKAPATVRRLLPAVAAQTELRGTPGAVNLMAELVSADTWSVDMLLKQPVFRLAILATDAAALFGYGGQALQTPARAPATSPAAVLQLVPPVVTRQERISAATPAPAQKKPPQKEWSNAEKQAMRNDRAAGLSDTAIGKKFGVSRQRIAELIGSQKVNREGYAKPRPMNQA